MLARNSASSSSQLQHLGVLRQVTRAQLQAKLHNKRMLLPLPLSPRQQH